MKTCSVCKQPRPPDRFPKRGARCKDCHNAYLKQYREGKGKAVYEARKERAKVYLRQYYQDVGRAKQFLEKYGITIERFEELLEDQDHSCAICHEPFEEDKKRHIDHCHSTLIVRGVLCENCNRGLGMFRDRPDLLHGAATYLEVPR